MDALFFGKSSSPIFGAYHPAIPASDLRRGVVLCYPFGQEYMRAHRSFRILAGQLVRKGFHVFRLDYRGTGDSFGALEDYCPEDWVEDISVAVDELRDTAGIRQVGLIGLRLGGLLASEVVCRRDDIQFLVLWDTVISGRRYLEELEAEIKKASVEGSRSRFFDANGVMHFNGFAMLPDFQENIKSFKMALDRMPPATQVLHIVSHEAPDFEWLNKEFSRSPSFHYRHAPAPHNWNYVDHVGGIMLPQPVISAITEWL